MKKYRSSNLVLPLGISDFLTPFFTFATALFYLLSQ